MAKKALPSPEVLRQLLRYEPETGKLFWLPRANAPQWNGKFSGREAFTTVSHGYYVGAIFNVRVSAHRVIWAIQTGAWPTHEVDHIDRCRKKQQMGESSGGDKDAELLQYQYPQGQQKRG